MNHDERILLAVDVGNTETVVGMFHQTAEPQSAEDGLIDHWRIATQLERSSDELAAVVQQFLTMRSLSLQSVNGIAVASVVPRLTTAIRRMAERYLDATPFVLTSDADLEMAVRYDRPSDVGADRLANALAARQLYGTPAVVVDFGTAVTFDAVSADGDYVGGAIVPGIEISLDALIARAAGLRGIELTAPPSAIGRTTGESMQSGLLNGYAALVDGLCRRIFDELGGATVIATGGMSSVIAPLCKEVTHVEPWLTLHGLRLAYARSGESSA